MSTPKKQPKESTEELQAAFQALLAQGAKEGMIRAEDLGALLEKRLREPDLLTADDIDRILSSIFADPSIQARLTNALDFRRANPATKHTDDNADES